MTVDEMLLALEGKRLDLAELRGEIVGARGLLLRGLVLRFGMLPERTVERVYGAHLDELYAWGSRLLDAETLDELFPG